MITDPKLLISEEARKRFGHVAVRLDHYIVVFGGRWQNNEPLLMDMIWMYNLYTEQWSMQEIPVEKTAPPPTHEACAAVIGSDVYMFGGNRAQTLTNALWKLSKTPNACFEWSKIKILSQAKSPSPRHRHSGWEYNAKLWAFGGSGGSPIGFLNDNGDYNIPLNNQLLCFDPNCQEWMNPKCSGSVPPPIAAHATSVITDNVWQFGGYTSVSGAIHELYMLNMPSLSWTIVETGYPQPLGRALSSFTALTNTYLVLHGGFDDKNYHTCVLDLSTLSWKELKFVVDLRRVSHTCTLDINSNAVVIGGERNYFSCPIFENVHVMLEAKSLQQLATQTIHKNRTELPLEALPKKLRSLL